MYAMFLDFQIGGSKPPPYKKCEKICKIANRVSAGAADSRGRLSLRVWRKTVDLCAEVRLAETEGRTVGDACPYGLSGHQQKTARNGVSGLQKFLKRGAGRNFFQKVSPRVILLI